MQYFKEEIKHAKSILDVQIIVPCKQGVSSVASLNHIAQQIYNPKSKKQYKIMKSGVVQWVLKVGDKVIFQKYAGTEVKIEGNEYTILRQSDILAVVE